jgi:hypothetical protein
MDEAFTTPIAEIGASSENERAGAFGLSTRQPPFRRGREPNRLGEAAAIQNETGGGSFRATARRERVSSGVIT